MPFAGIMLDTPTVAGVGIHFGGVSEKSDSGDGYPRGY
jgi:hypothetical protein